MFAIQKEIVDNVIFDEIKTHPAWKGHIPGLQAEKMLRGKNRPYLYLLRAGEFESAHEADFYVTFVHSDLSIRHQPVIITVSAEGWYYEQGGGGGPFDNISINEVLHLIMHCSKEQAQPFTRFAEHV
jgi:hypothetical protein